MKNALLFTALFFAIYCTSVAKSEFRFKENCSIVLSNNNWFKNNSANNNLWSNNRFNNNSSNNNWLLKSFDTNEEATISISAKGDFRVYETRNISTIMKEALLFKIAILKKGATISEMFSDTSFKSLTVELILEKCKPGDRIIVFLMDEENYSLNQNIIEVVEGGC